MENQFRVYIALSNREVDAREICESHRELVESICAGDAERAERLARANIVPPEADFRKRRMMVGVRLRLEADPPRIMVESDGGSVELPALWLRERCQDPVHLDPQTQQRLFDPHRLPDDLTLLHVEPSGENRAWLAFSDGYSGEYELSSLAADLDLEDGLPPEIPWRADLVLDTVSVDGRTLDSEEAAPAVGADIPHSWGRHHPQPAARAREHSGSRAPFRPCAGNQLRTPVRSLFTAGLE